MSKLVQVFAAALIATVLIPLQAARADDRERSLRWRGCHPEAGPNFQCASLRVPLDYDRPDGRQISLALARLPATDPAAGSARCSSTRAGRAAPGSSSSSAPARSCSPTRCGPGSTWSASTRAASSGSTPLHCFDTLEEAVAVLRAVRLPGDAATRSSSWIAARPQLALGVRSERGGPIIDHMSTAERGPRPRPAAPGGRRPPSSPMPATRTARYLGVDLRQPVPRPGRARS